MILTPPAPAATTGWRAPTVVAWVAHARWVPSLQREAFAARLAELPPSAGTIVVHTCHRVELYVAPTAIDGRPLEPPGLNQVPAGTERLEDADAARHLITVACGLDSAVIGEDQILHQLRETIASRHAELPLDPVLDRLFQVALHAGRRVHTWFTGAPRSLADLGLDRIEAAVGSLDGRPILVVGAGRMGRLAAIAAHRRGSDLYVTNRTHERAAALAHEFDGRSVPYGEDQVLPPLAGVIVAVGGPWALGPTDRARLVASDAVVVDLSSPPAIDLELHAALGDRSVTVDDLAGGPADAPEDRLGRRVQALISGSGREYCRWLRTRDAVPAIQAMADAAERHRRDELDRLLRHLPDLAEDDRRLIEQMSHRLVAGILHDPLAALNADQSGDLERAARDLFRL